MKADAEPLLSVRAATKIYAGVYALDGVDLDAYPGDPRVAGRKWRRQVDALHDHFRRGAAKLRNTFHR